MLLAPLPRNVEPPGARMKLTIGFSRALFLTAFMVALSVPSQAQTRVSPVSDPCPRPQAGSVVQSPPDIISAAGVLDVRFSYQHAFDAANRELFCFMTPDLP
jgi:hypothetical protein